MNISVFGLGYVGAVSAACLADHGHRVWGVDINPNKVDLINQGQSPVLENGLPEKLAKVVKAGFLQATTSGEEALSNSEVSFVIVATPSAPTGEIDPAHLYRACEQIAGSLRELERKQTVVIRSSVLPDIFKQCQAIFDKQAPGLVDLCTNPEFLREGSAIADFENPPFTIIGTTSPQVEATIRNIYAEIKSPVHILGPLEATMIKYASNVFHGLKVAFANEIGALCQAQGIDSHAVMSTFVEDTKLNVSGRYLQPGFAFGGSCLPKDIRAVLSTGQHYAVETPLIASILTSNNNLIDRAFNTIMTIGNHQVGLVGLSFKADTDDLRESPFANLVRRLTNEDGITLKVYDPNVAESLQNKVGRGIIEEHLPRIDELLTTDLHELLAHSRTLVVAHGYPEMVATVDKIPAETTILDFAHVPALKSARNTYHGINW